MNPTAYLRVLLWRDRGRRHHPPKYLIQNLFHRLKLFCCMKKFLRLSFAFSGLFFFATALFAQNKVVTGSIVDQNNIPLSGASVTVKGKKGGVTTDGHGAFKISVPPGSDVLVFSYVGAQHQRFPSTAGLFSPLAWMLSNPIWARWWSSVMAPSGDRMSTARSPLSLPKISPIYPNPASTR